MYNYFLGVLCRLVLVNKGLTLTNCTRFLYLHITKTLSYPWNSHQDYLAGTSSLVDVSFCLGMLSDKIKIAKNKYLEFMEDQASFDIKEAVKSSDFLSKEPVKQSIESKSRDLQLSLDDLIKLVVEFLGITEEWLLSLKSRNRKIVTARNIVVHLAVKHNIAGRAALVEKLKLTPYQISRGYYAAVEKEESSALIKAIEKMQ